MRVHFIKNEYMYQLEVEVNVWIRENSNVEIIDIKYCTVPCYTSSEYSVMIIYR